MHLSNKHKALCILLTVPDQCVLSLWPPGVCLKVLASAILLWLLRAPLSTLMFLLLLLVCCLSLLFLRIPLHTHKCQENIDACHCVELVSRLARAMQIRSMGGMAEEQPA